MLEVILSLLLASFVLMVLATAIDLHLRLLDSNRTDIEQAQLARAVLRHIATDLRNAVQYNPVDVSKMVSASTLKSTAAAGQTTPGAPTPPETATPPTTASTPSSTDTSSTGTTIAPSSTPGLYGDSKQIQIDTSRLPRVVTPVSTDAVTSSQTADITSEVKTVTYMLVGTDSSTNASSSGARGLIRYEMDRAAAVFAATKGSYTTSLNSQEPLAPEVTDLVFQYYNGSEWVDTWDSSQNGGLPKAVQVSIAVVQPTRGTSSLFAAFSDSSEDTQDTTRIYRLMVHLPGAELNASTTQSTDSTKTDSALK